MKQLDSSNHSLSVRVAQAAFGLTMLTLGVLFLGFMVLAAIEIPYNARKANDNAGSVLGDAIATDVNFVLTELRALGRSPLLWTSLSDSAGREAYLKPFLDARNQVQGEVGLALADYRGRLVVGKIPDGVAEAAFAQVVSQAMERNAPILTIVDAQGKAMMLAAEPVVFPYTKDAIGALVKGVNLSLEFERRAGGLGSDLGAHLMHGERLIAEHGPEESSHFMLVGVPLVLQSPVNGGALRVEVYSTVNPWLVPMASRFAVLVVLALVLGWGAWRAARQLGERIAGRLQSLAAHCEAGTAANMPEDPGRDEIGVLSRALSSAMRSYNEINESLEERVAERTEQLIASEQRLRTAIDSVEEGFAIFDPQERLVYCNRKYREGFASMSELLHPGTRFGDLMHEWARRHRVEFSEAENAAWEARRLEEFRQGGSWTRYQEDTGRWIQGIERRTNAGYSVSFRLDITELVVARQRAEAASEAKSRFLATMSHELRTPLNGVLGMAQLLQTPNISEAERLEFAGIILHSGESLLNVLNDILDLSKIEAGKMELHWAACDVGQLLKDVDVLFREPAHSKGLELSVQWMGDASRRYRLDPQRLRQVLINLVSNGIKFTEHGRVELTAREMSAEEATAADMPARPGEAMLEFTVRDTGLGIPADKISALFQPFTQVDNSDTRRHGGTGLGLSIVQRLAELMGGKVGVQSEAGAGSLFWVRIGAEVLAEQAGEPVAEVRARVVAELPQQTGRVLVVEDHPMNQTLTQAMLDKLGLDSVVAGDGQEALDLMARGERFAVALMDLQMPVLDGMQTTREIRNLEAQRPGDPRLPIIALTANVQDGVREACLAAGMDDVLHKPLDFAGLRETLQRWLPQDQTASTVVK